MLGYTLTSAAIATDAQMVIRDDGAFIPPDRGNSDFCAYLAWLADGNSPEPCAAPPMPVPQQVSRRQFFQAAAHLGLITEDEALAALDGVIPAVVLTAVATLPAGDQFPARMAVKGASTFDRSSPILIAIAAAMSEPPADLDALFTLAATL